MNWWAADLGQLGPSLHGTPDLGLEVLGAGFERPQIPEQ
jgi:hypothetical protein